MSEDSVPTPLELSTVNTNSNALPGRTNDLSAKQSRTDRLEDMEEEHGPIFSDSVHRYLVYYRSVGSFNGCFLSMVVLIIQYSLYSTLVDEPIAVVQDDVVPVEIPYSDCGSSYGRHTIGTFEGSNFNNTLKYIQSTYMLRTNFELQCEANEYWVLDKKNIGSFFLSLTLIWMFTAADFFSCLAVFIRVPGLWAKIVGIFLFLETIYAISVCNLYLYAAFWSGDKFAAIVNTVGVLFIHDMDEFAYAALKLLDKKWLNIEKSKVLKCFCCCCCKCCKRNIRLLAFAFWFAAVIVFFFISTSFQL